MTKAQYSTLSDVCKEAAAVDLGGVVIGGFLGGHFKLMLSGISLVVYIILVVLAVYLRKKGE
ncbi:hypothetical protein L0337_41700 [candidate division KSB1 bacterium]|nr:hypothetical protein [candidate division KSB1 bacterium]